jgi:hypothetical protein
VNLNDVAVPVIGNIVWVVTSHFVFDLESFERVRAGDACKSQKRFFGYGADKRNIGSIKAKNDSTSQALTWKVE